MTLAPCKYRAATSDRVSYCALLGKRVRPWLESDHPCDGCTHRAAPSGTPVAAAAPPPGRMVRLVVPPCPPPPEPRSERCVLTVGVGPKPAAELAITRPLMENYAKRCGADFVAITDLPPQPHGCGYKYVAAAVAARYKQTLYLDADVVVRPNAPDIFAVIPEGRWGLVDDFPSVQGNGSTQWFAGEIAAVQRLAGLPAAPLAWTGNTGVMVMPPHAAALYAPPPFDVPASMWCAEQHWASLLMAGHPDVVDLPRRWNVSAFAKDFWEHTPTSHFLHAAGIRHPFRLTLLKRWAAGNLDPIPCPHDLAWRPPWPINAAKPAPIRDPALCFHALAGGCVPCGGKPGWVCGKLGGPATPQRCGACREFDPG